MKKRNGLLIIILLALFLALGAIVTFSNVDLPFLSPIKPAFVGGTGGLSDINPSLGGPGTLGCYDTDGGTKFTIFGTVILSNGAAIDDSCSSDHILNERVCQKYKAATIVRDCRGNGEDPTETPCCIKGKCQACPSCTSQCTLGQSMCINNNSYYTCGDYNNDSCLEYGGNPTVCSVGQKCQDGECVEDGDYYECDSSSDTLVFEKSSDRLNLGETITKVFGSIVDKNGLPNALAKETYTAHDFDEFDYEQTLMLHEGLELNHFSDAGYEQCAGLPEQTPVVGIRMPAGQQILDYELNFLTSARSEIVNNHLEDFENSDISIMGRNYRIIGAMSSPLSFTMLSIDCSPVILHEGETITYLLDGYAYQMVLNTVSQNETVLEINGEVTLPLGEGETQVLSNGKIIGVLSIHYVGGHPELSSVELVLGTHKVEMYNDRDILIDGDTNADIQSEFFTTVQGNELLLNKIKINWIAEDESFVAPGCNTQMPGLRAYKLTMGNFSRSGEEYSLVKNDGDNSVRLQTAIKEGDVSINLLYNNPNTGFLMGTGKSSSERLVTSNSNNIIFDGGIDMYFIATYDNGIDAESYLMRATAFATENGINKTTIQHYVGGWVDEKVNAQSGDVILLGNTILTVGAIDKNARTVVLTAGSNVYFNRLYSKNGLKMYLPVANCSVGGVGFFCPGQDAGFSLWFAEEDINNNPGAGAQFSLAITKNSDNRLSVKPLLSPGLEIGDTDTYESYIASPLATRLLYYAYPDQDYVELYYPDSESYAQVFLQAFYTNT